MSKWTEFRDALLDNMRGSTLNITEQTKQDFMEQFMEAGSRTICGKVCGNGEETGGT